MQPAAGATGIAASQDGRLSFLQPDTGESAEADPSYLHGSAQLQPHRGGSEASAPTVTSRTQHQEAGGNSTQELGIVSSAAGGKERARRKARLPKGLVDYDTAG